jgi:AAA domain/CHC2 zinc finger/Toprim-like
VEALVKYTCIDVAKAAGLEPGRKHGVEQLYRCPRHDDKHPSLSINTSKDVFLCGPCGVHGTAWQLAAFANGFAPSDKPNVLNWLVEHGLLPGNDPGGNYRKEPNRNGNGNLAAKGTSSIVETYPYRDEGAELLFEVVRFEPKDFRQRKPDGKGGWVWSLNGTRRVLYRLPEVLKATAVYIVEGEKDVHSLEALGLTATCNPCGAGKWRPEFAEFFRRDQRVVIIPDNDEPGHKHARQVAQFLLGRVQSLKIMEMPGLPEKGDVSDWLAAGGTLDQIESLAVAAPEFTQTFAADSAAMRFTAVGDLLNEPEEQTRWLVEDHLPIGGDSLLVAKPKVGKSTLARCLALAVARGDDFLGCKTAQGTVFYLALEEKRDEVRRHFRAMGARPEDPIFIFCAPSPADGLALLRVEVDRAKPVLIIVDPLFRFSRIKDGNDYAQVTNALEPLHVLARETGSHLLAVHHEGKRGGADGDGVLGSTALFAAVDTLLTMRRTERYRTLSSIQRYGTDLDEITLEYNTETRTLSAGVPRAAADEAEAANAILEFLRTQKEPVEESVIDVAVEGRKGVKVKALRQAVKDGRIVRTGAGKKGDTYRYSVSGSLVPNICGERTKQESEANVSHSNESSDACSRLCSSFG